MEKTPQQVADEIAATARRGYVVAELVTFERFTKALTREGDFEGIERVYNDLGAWFDRNPDARVIAVQREEALA